jgi:serine/threonine-protein kinase
MPREINPDIPEGLEDITMHAMDPNLNTRYPSATALLADLEEFRKNPSITFNYSDIPSMADSSDDTRTIPSKAISAAAQEKAVKKQSGNGISRNHTTSEEYKKNRKKASKTTTLVGIFCIFVFLIAIVWFMWNYALKGWLAPEEESRINVPTFQGSMLDDVISNPDYTMYYEFEVTTEENETYPEGYILKQDPAANRSVAVTDSKIVVKLTVSAGVDTVYMPDFDNCEYREASLELDQLEMDLKINISSASNDDYVEGRVFDQYPAAGTALVKGMNVYLTYSSGQEAEKVKVPNLYGLTQSQALSRLESYNLIGVPVEAHDDTAPEGKVFLQDIEKGEMVDAKTEIVFYISTGPEVTTPTTPDEPDAEEPTTPTTPTTPDTPSTGQNQPSTGTDPAEGGSTSNDDEQGDDGDEELGDEGEGEGSQPNG